MSRLSPLPHPQDYQACENLKWKNLFDSTCKKCFCTRFQFSNVYFRIVAKHDWNDHTTRFKFEVVDQALLNWIFIKSVVSISSLKYLFGCSIMAASNESNILTAIVSFLSNIFFTQVTEKNIFQLSRLICWTKNHLRGLTLHNWFWGRQANYFLYSKLWACSCQGISGTRSISKKFSNRDKENYKTAFGLQFLKIASSTKWNESSLNTNGSSLD